MGSASSPDFSMPPRKVSFSGFLWDMDGTIVDSTPAIVKHWHSIASEISMDAEAILKTSHGRRSIDVLKIIAPERANWEYVAKVEGQIPILYSHLATELPGARALLESMVKHDAAWAIVTSGSKPLVDGWLRLLGFPPPPHLVTAESVPQGKPDPACYRMGLEKLGLGRSSPLSADDVLVIEDSPAGIRAGKDAGCKVLGLVTSHTCEQVAAAEPDWIVKDLASVCVVGDRSEDGRLTLEIKDALKL